jgi:thermitase
MMNIHPRLQKTDSLNLTMPMVVASLMMCFCLMDFSSLNETGYHTVVLASQSAAGYDPGTVIVELKPRRAINDMAGRHNLVVVEDVDEQTWLLRIPDGRTVEQVMREVNPDRDVKSVEPNFLFQVPEINQRTIANVDGPGATDAYDSQQALHLIRAFEAQAVADGSGVVVAVIDTGVDTTHPSLGNLAAGYDFVDNDNDPSEVSGGQGYGHGTMVAGLIKLVAPGVTIMPVRAFGPDGHGTTTNIAKAIRFAVANGADVINLSFGTIGQPQALRGAMTLALRRTTLVTAAGNDNTNAPVQYPASVEESLTVAATDVVDYKAAMSNYGSYVDVCAPGVDVVSTYPGGGFASATGTSFSAALVSGAVALVKWSGHTNAAQAVIDSAVNIDGLNPGFVGMLGRGRLDVFAAISR